MRLAIQFLFNMWSEIRSNFWFEIFTWKKMHLCIDAQACSMSAGRFVCCSKGTQWQSRLQQLQMQQAPALRRPKRNHFFPTPLFWGSHWSLNCPKACQERCPCRTPHHSRQYQAWWEGNCQVTRPPWTWGKSRLIKDKTVSRISPPLLGAAATALCVRVAQGVLPRGGREAACDVSGQ